MPDLSMVADTVAGITRTVAGVAGLHPGMFGEVATYLPGRRVTGVRISDDRIAVHISVLRGAAVRETAAAVRAAVAAAVPGRPVDVTVEDISGEETTAHPPQDPGTRPTSPRRTE